MTVSHAPSDRRTCSSTVERSLFMNTFLHGISQYVGSFQARDVVTYNNMQGNRWEPDASVSGVVSMAPTMFGGAAQCMVYVPAGSNLKGAAADGGDIGANIVYRYQNGALTSQKLWSPDGRFPCGALVPGINDVSGKSCIDVNVRLNVGVAGCPAPVLIAGGPKLPDDAAVLQMVADSLAAGGKGVVFGRNIWQHRHPAAMVRALRAVIHEGASGREAADLLPA